MSLLYIYAHAVGQEVDILTEKREGGWMETEIHRQREDMCERD